MSLNFQENGFEAFGESKSFQTLKVALKKKPYDRTDEDVDLISQNIFDLKYFRDMVHKESGRLEFAKGCAKYLRYEHFPRGMEVLRKGDRGDHFYIILSGEAYVYIPKNEPEIKQDKNEDKQRIFEKYSEFLTQMDKFGEHNMILSQLSQLHEPTSRLASLDGRSKSFAYSTQSSTTFGSNTRKIESAAKALLSGPNRVLKSEELKHDLSYQEKLLLLNNKPVFPGYFDQGIATFKKVNMLRTGDSFGELALIFNQPRLASIIASEDLHLLSFTSSDYRNVFESEIQNVVEKQEFFNGIFPSLSSAHIARFCYLLEEKTFKFNDVIYKEGDIADGIYIVRQGEVQLSQMTKTGSETPRAAGAKRGSITKRKITAATLVTGNFFGDIETLNNTKRNYTATSASTTFVYRLKRQAYHGIIAPHFPAIANFLKTQAESTEHTRQNRMENTKKIQLLALPSFDRLPPETVQKFSEDIKVAETKIKGLAPPNRRKSEVFPLHFKTRLDTIVLKEEDDEDNPQDFSKDLSIIPQAIEHVQLQTRPSLFDFKDSKVFALVSPRETKPEQSILTPLSFPNRRPSEISMSPSPWFPSPSKVPRLTISNCGSPENKNNGSSTAANTTTSRKFLPQLTKSRGSFSGLDIEKIADFGFSGLVNRLKHMPPGSPTKQSLPSSPKKNTANPTSPSRRGANMDEIPSMEHIDTPKELSLSVKKDMENPFNKTLAKLIKDKVEQKSTSPPKTERVNLHVRHNTSKLPFKQMKSPSPEKLVPKSPRQLLPLSVSQGWKTDRTKNSDVTVMTAHKSEEKQLLQGSSLKMSIPVIDVAKIKRVEHDNVVRNEVLSARSVDARVKKTTHNMFRVFKQSICK